MRNKRHMKQENAWSPGRLVIVGVLVLAFLAAGGTALAAAKASAGTQAPATRHVLDRIPAHMLPQSAPVPISPEYLRVSNAWLVSDGTTLVAVYAGQSGTDTSAGRFVIVRQNTITGKQTVTTVNVPGAGKLSLVHPPAGTAVETSAQQDSLTFRDAHGGNGTLNLRSNKTRR